MAKSPLRSKTIWVNGLTLLAGVIGVAAGSDLIAAHPQWAAWLVSVLGAVNVALRFITSDPIGFE